MTMIFDHNNNSEECQMFFDKINNGSPFRVITFIGPILSHFKNVMRSGYLSSEPTKQDRIEYHFRDNIFHFIFNVSNNFLSGKSRLTIEVPRTTLENIKLPDMKEIYVN
nr:hypothetical protein [Helicobacter pylori]